MGLISQLGRYAWRKWNINGVSASGPNKPATEDIFPFVDRVDEQIAALAAADAFQGEWNAASGSFPGSGAADVGDIWLVTTAGTTGGHFFAIGDRIVALVKNASATTFAGNWAVIPANARSIVPGEDLGAGTANAIQVTTEDAVTNGTIVFFGVFEENTGSPVTVSFNGETALTIKTNSGGDVAVGGLTAGMSVFGFVAGSTFRILNDQVSGAIVAQAEAAATAAEEAKVEAQAAAGALVPVTTDFVVNIPTDYPTLQAATDAISVRPIKQGLRILLTIEPGHALTNGLFVRDGDYSHFWIVSAAPAVSITGITQANPAVVTAPAHGLSNGQSVVISGVVGMTEVNSGVYVVANATADNFELLGVDSTSYGIYAGGGQIIIPVALAPGFVGVSDEMFDDTDDLSDNLIAGFNARLPTLACVIDAGLVADNGYYGIYNCEMNVMPECGVINAGHDAFVARTSRGNILRSIWDGANGAGIRVAHGSIVGAQAARANNCCRSPEEESNGAVDVSRTSILHFRLGQANGSGGSGINVRRNSVVTCEEGQCNSNRYAGIYINGGARVAAYGIQAKNNFHPGPSAGGKGYGIWCVNGTIDAHGATLTGNGNATEGNGLDIRIGSVNDGAGAFVDLTSGTTTNSSSAGAPNIVNVISATAFNFLGKYGAVFNKNVNGPLEDVGVFSATGATSGKALNGTILDSSRTGTGTQPHQRFYNSGTGGLAGQITTSGASPTTSYGTTSDALRKLDDGELPLAKAESVLRAIVFHSFRWKATGTEDEGVFAQELYNVYPKAVQVGGWRRIDPETGEYAVCTEFDEDAYYQPWGVDYSLLIPIVAKSVQGLLVSRDAITLELEEIRGAIEGLKAGA